MHLVDAEGLHLHLCWGDYLTAVRQQILRATGRASALMLKYVIPNCAVYALRLGTTFSPYGETK